MTGAAFTERINLFNSIDFATAGILYTNMYYRVDGDTGYQYVRLRLRAGPNFRDNWQARGRDSNVPKWIRPARARRPAPAVRWFSLAWNPEDATSLTRSTRRAVILSMLTAARSRAVGADDTGVAGAFTDTIDAEADFGLTEATDHHSYQFNRTIQTNWVFYRDALRPQMEP